MNILTAMLVVHHHALIFATVPLSIYVSEVNLCYSFEKSAWLILFKVMNLGIYMYVILYVLIFFHFRFKMCGYTWKCWNFEAIHNIWNYDGLWEICACDDEEATDKWHCLSAGKNTGLPYPTKVCPMTFIGWPLCNFMCTHVLQELIILICRIACHY